ncbi:MAG: L-threonylcarbamoyladenylate synthase [Bacteroidia bacterium]|nr:L-threonylcarbamoyladenylate synthase [Bacteroidia bacterium]
METLLSTEVDQAVEILLRDEVVALPTETVYGLAANALSVVAVEKIFMLKNRPKADPLIVHVRNIGALESIEIEPPLWAERLMRLFWPGPLTILLPKSPKIPDLVTAGSTRVALRSPNHPLTQAVLERVPFPLAAPSANPFGYTSPTTADHVLSYFAGKIPLILDGGPCEAGIESTIIGEEDGRFFLYRPGALSRELIEEALGTKLFSKAALLANALPTAPGQYPRHYSPRKPLLYGWIHLPAEPRASLVYFTESEVPSEASHCHVLTPSSSLQEAAQTLYAILHQCDQEGTDYILVQRIPTLDGLGEALHDRLRRANTPALFTLGHSTHTWAGFLALLQRYEVNALVDIRRQPYSKYVPQFSQGQLQKALHEAGIAYEWQPNPRHLFRSIEKLLAQHLHVALLCAEGEPHRCHRYSLSDELSQRGLAVFHILPEGRLELHRAPISLPFGEMA